MFIFLYVVLLLLPGWAALYAIGRSPASVGEIPLCSLGVFVLSAAIIGCFEWNALLLIYLYFGFIFLAFLGAGWRAWIIFKIGSEAKQWPCKLDPCNLLVVVIMLIYGLWAGPFTEVPADVYWHLGRITELQEWFDSGEILKIGGLTSVLNSINYYWYRFVALSLHLTGTELREQLYAINLINILVFSAAFYSFAKVVLSEGHRIKNISLSALIATIFMVLHFGVGPFSYIRYYTFAPGFFALVGFFALMAIFIRALSVGMVSIRLAMGSVLLAIALAALHFQEALYLIVMAAMITGVFFLRSKCSLRDSSVRTLGITLGNLKYVPLSSILFAGIFIYLIGHFYLYIFSIRQWPLDGGFLQPLSDLLPFAKNLFVLKPTQQFYQVLTVWGVFAYFLYFLSHRKKEVPSYISAGLWLPLFTVFNPVFIDLFLRISFAEVVWRLCFLIPVELYAAWYLVRGWEEYCQSRVSVIGDSAVNRKSFGQASRLFIISLLLVVFLIPINSRYLENTYSKLSMLSAVTPEADYRHFEDLLNFLNTLPPEDLLTDQVTGYVVNAFTPHTYYGHKFSNLYTTITYLPEYQLKDIDVYRGGYLVINARDGDLSSFSHEIGGHWPADMRLYSKQYSHAFWRMVLENPDVFTNIWQLNKIQVYQIAD